MYRLLPLISVHFSISTIPWQLCGSHIKILLLIILELFKIRKTYMYSLVWLNQREYQKKSMHKHKLIFNVHIRLIWHFVCQWTQK